MNPSSSHSSRNAAANLVHLRKAAEANRGSELITDANHKITIGTFEGREVFEVKYEPKEGIAVQLSAGDKYPYTESPSKQSHQQLVLAATAEGKEAQANAMESNRSFVADLVSEYGRDIAHRAVAHVVENKFQGSIDKFLFSGVPLMGSDVVDMLNQADAAYEIEEAKRGTANENSKIFYDALKRQYGSQAATIALEGIEGLGTKALSRGTSLTPEERKKVEDKAIEVFIKLKVKAEQRAASHNEQDENQLPLVTQIFRDFIEGRDGLSRSELDAYSSMALNLYAIKKENAIRGYYVELAIERGLSDKSWAATPNSIRAVIDEGLAVARDNNPELKDFYLMVRNLDPESTVSIDQEASADVEGSVRARRANMATAGAFSVALQAKTIRSIVD
ncbi:MAG TPA: hypothetical protein PLV25_07080, partial [Opitutales bacterium]|nr:hypothetical protein [Opitutales bacterium]